jgi:hypothetical protein
MKGREDFLQLFATACKLQVMGGLSSGEPASLLLAQAKAAGFEVSCSQLARWHRQGLLARPQQRALGRGKGTESLYPAGTSNQLLALCKILRQTRLLDQAGWCLWWEGFSVDKKHWMPAIEKAGQRWDAAVSEMSEAVDGDDADYLLKDSLIDDLDKLSETRTENRVIRRARKRVGKAQFSRLLRILLETAVGQFRSWDEIADTDDGENDTDAKIAERGMGISRARKDRLGNAGPWLSGDIAAHLVTLSSLFARNRLADVYKAASDEQLLQARDELRQLIRMFAGLGPLLEGIFGRHAFGFGTLSELDQSSSARLQAGLILLWLLVKQKSGMVQGMENLLRSVDAANVAINALRGLESLRSEVPAFAGALAPMRLSAAMRNPEEMKRLQVDLIRLFENNRKAVGAFLGRHPNFKLAIGE